MSQKFSILLDCGGTSIKSYVFDNGELTLIGNSEGWNICDNFDKSIEGINKHIKSLDHNSDINIFLAGYMSLSKEKKIELLNSINYKISFITTDAFFPPFIHGNNSFAINFGTGTFASTFNKELGKGEIYWGLGHLKYEPCSGYGLAFEFIENIEEYEDTKSRQEKKEISKLFKKLWNIQKNKIKFIEIFTKQLNDFFNEEVITAIREKKVIVLNGSITQIPEFKLIIESKVSSIIKHPITYK